MTPVLQVEQVSRLYGQRWAVKSASLSLQQGRITCLLGPSGCGKSSLLRLIAGLEPLDEGRILIRGDEMSAKGALVLPEHRGVGLVFQDNALFPHLDVTANIGFGIRHLSKAERQERVSDLLERFHIRHLAHSWPHMLSGGEQQRVAIARALAREPSLLLLDEPFSGLDTHLRDVLRKSLLADLRAAGATVLIVTHDPAEAMAMADDLLLMAGGRILQSGTPKDCYDHPQSLTAARLLGDALAFPVMVEQGRARTPWGDVATDGLPDGAADLVLRPSYLSVGTTGVAAQLQDIRYLGGEYGLALQVDDQLIHLKSDQPVAATSALKLDADLTQASIFAR